MKISFLTTHLWVFGSVRELVENANVMTDLGHEVTIYNKMDKKCNWLPCKAEVIQIDTNREIKITTDVLILMDSPFPDLFYIFENADAKFKTMIMMGFDPNNFELQGKDNLKENIGREGTRTQKNLVHILKNYTMCADGWWQIDHFESLGLKRGHSIGGINLDQFKVTNTGMRTIDVGYSGDMRERKGTPVLQTALKDLHYSRDFYWNKGDQNYLVDFLNNCTLFIDNHLRAGWCNPVLEAMACGCVVICNEIGAVKDFVISGETGLFAYPNLSSRYKEMIKYLMDYPKVIELLQKASLEKVKEFDYKKTVPKFIEFLEKQL